jgi:hypothetical protein
MAILYSTMDTSGIDINSVFMLDPVNALEYPAPPFLPGNRAFGTDGSDWVYCTASISIAPGSALLISTVPGSWSVSLLGGATVATAPTGQLVAVSGGGTGSVTVPAPSGTQTAAYFWAQRAGNCPNLSAAGAAIPPLTQLHSSPTVAGGLGTTGAGAATTYSVNGVVFTQNTATAGSVNTAVLNYPVVGATN